MQVWCLVTDCMSNNALETFVTVESEKSWHSEQEPKGERIGRSF